MARRSTNHMKHSLSTFRSQDTHGKRQAPVITVEAEVILQTPAIPVQRRRVPFQAFLVKPPVYGGYSDTTSVSSVLVLELDQTNSRAKVRIRVGSVFEVRSVPFSALSTTIEGVFQKIQPFLEAIAPCAALTNEPADHLTMTRAIAPLSRAAGRSTAAAR